MKNKLHEEARKKGVQFCLEHFDIKKYFDKDMLWLLANWSLGQQTLEGVEFSEDELENISNEIYAELKILLTNIL